jgi:hypothetical protein
LALKVGEKIPALFLRIGTTMIPDRSAEPAGEKMYKVLKRSIENEKDSGVFRYICSVSVRINGSNIFSR